MKPSKFLSEHSEEDEDSTDDECSKCFVENEIDSNSICSLFCRNASIHGLKHIGKEKQPLIVRIFWLLCVLAATGLSLYLITECIIKPMQSNPVIMAFENEDISVDLVPFPAVTICNINKRKRYEYDKFFEILLEEYLMDNITSTNETKKTLDYKLHAYHYIENICKSSDSFTESIRPNNLTGYSEATQRPKDKDHMKIWKYIVNILHKCEDMIMLCMWNNEAIDCKKYFDLAITEFGHCCTFNMMPASVWRKGQRLSRRDKEHPEVIEKWRNWNIDRHIISKEEKQPSRTKINPELDVPKHQRKAGQYSGLSLLLNPELNEYDNSCRTIDCVGFKVQVHSPVSSAKVSELGNTIMPNRETFLGIEAEITTANRDVNKAALEQRHCYFRNEYNLTSFTLYTQKNCFDECESNKIFTKCECVMHYMARTNERLCIKNSEHGCIRSYKKELRKHGLHNICAHCWPACTHLEYFADITHFPLRDDVDLWKNQSTNIAQWKDKSLSIVHIFFAKKTVDSKIRRILFDFQDILATAGGFLGLTLGFSMISVMEPVYFLSRQIIRKATLLAKERYPGRNRLKVKPAVQNSGLLKGKPIQGPKITHLSVISQSYPDEPYLKMKQIKKTIPMDWFHR